MATKRQLRPLGNRRPAVRIAAALSPFVLACLAVGGCPTSGRPQPNENENAAAQTGADAPGDFELVGALTENLRNPARIAIRADGTVLVTDAYHRHVARFDADGEPLAPWPVDGRPIAIALQPDSDRILISFIGSSAVSAFVRDPASDTIAPVGAVGDTSGPLVQPTDIDINPVSGDVYVADGAGDRFVRFSAEGSPPTVIGERGVLSGQFNYAAGVAVSPQGDLVVVADQDNFRIQVFDPAGEFMFAAGGRTKRGEDDLTAGWIARPLGIAVNDAGWICVTDGLTAAVSLFDRAGADLGVRIPPSEGVGPAGDLAFSPDGRRLYVVRPADARVDVYAVPLQLPTPGRIVRNQDGARSGENLHDRPADDPHNTGETGACKRCHGLGGFPGGDMVTTRGQFALCASCHTSAGQAAVSPIAWADCADWGGAAPGTAPGRGRSHAWDVPAVNAAADSSGPATGGRMARYLDREGRIKCATCHSAHDDDFGTPYLRASNQHDAICKECHAPRATGPGQPGTHPVGFDYPGGTGEYPVEGELDSARIRDGTVECTSCHAVHFADSGGANGGDGDGRLLRADPEQLCKSCHTQHKVHAVTGSWVPTCLDCHDVHDSSNSNRALLSRRLAGRDVTFLDNNFADDQRSDFMHGESGAGFDGVCEVCHTRTLHHTNSAGGDHSHYRRWTCTHCHQHDAGFMPTCAKCHSDFPE